MQKLTSFTSDLTGDELNDLVLWLQLNIEPVPNDALGTPCWRWTSLVNKAGYALVHVPHQNTPRPAHVVSYELYRDLVPEDENGERLQLDHLCAHGVTDREQRIAARRCINPEHVRPASHRENMATGFNVTKTKCKHGHPRQQGQRHCPDCIRRRYQVTRIIKRQAARAAQQFEDILDRHALVAAGQGAQ